MSTPSDTPERKEWEELLTAIRTLVEIGYDHGEPDASGEPSEGRYAAATVEAYLLDEVEQGRPLGFIWEHHDAIDEAVMTWRAEAGSFDDPATPSVNEHERANYALMLEALEKLAALLPPKEEAP